MIAFLIGSAVVIGIVWLLYRAAQAAERHEGGPDGGAAFGGWDSHSDNGGTGGDGD